MTSDEIYLPNATTVTGERPILLKVSGVEKRFEKKSSGSNRIM